SNTHEIDIPVNLLASTNQLHITANNTFGNDVKHVELILLNNINVHPHAMTTPTSQSNPVTTETPHVANTPVFHGTINSNSFPQGGNQTNGTPPDNGNSSGSNMNGMGAHHNKPGFALVSPGTNPYTSMSGVISIAANLS